ncbi:CCAAT displacement transcription factor COY1 [Kluyveromyces lactis]|uniref:Protein CASP n=1 Tax=Kluyveromyces lactis (strain ATCC 8585 / CBS 2359 / DSM 70799 / NBRC 1267 / NRRL Y-1140 / WM37) TaxID=284590 RepID=Q6CXQ4_KLULA|nr:uncharacterized protein KLLA0_A06402g [Kluyveromyces lactis]CAH02873.1 KLLA0A06402p [Kluyveromyces lactis]|eukprot:XP_451285.1 uncharacterized protein KLLA0_A06402g [Kluyveromyces lactis]
MNLSTYEHALSLWKEAGFSSIQSLLDDSIAKIKDLETSSLESRKTLASETKKYKKLPDDEKPSQSLKLVKEYQKEIDSLTTRSTFSEKVVIELYEKLIEQPDPTGILESIVEELKKDGTNVDDIKAENQKLAAIVSKCADYDTLKKRLSDLEQNSAKTLSNRLIAKEKEITSKWEEKQRNWNNREDELLKQLETLKNTNSILEKKIGAQVDLEQQEDGDDDTVLVSGKNSAQSELLVQELEAAQIRIMSLESRNEELNSEVTKLKSDEQQDSIFQEKETKLNQLESENAKLVTCLEEERKSLKETSQTLSSQLKSSALETQTYKSELETLRRKLTNYSDYEKIKQELNAMKKIEFGTSDDSDNENDDGDDSITSSLKHANQKLQNNLVKANTEKNKYMNETQTLKKSIEALYSKIQNLETLNAKLEADIEKVEDVTNQFSDTQSMMSGATRQISNRHATNEKLSPTSSIIGIPEEKELDTFSGNFNGSPSILPIVTKQRDRFRSRNLELERQIKHCNQEQTKLKVQVKELKADNSKLYEKAKLLSSYSNNSAVRNTVDLESPFSEEYEESLHPLSSFKERELERYERRKMPPLERLFLSFAKVILANKQTRMLFMLYCLGLHGLVMVMTIYVTSFTNYITPDVSSSSGSMINTNQ